MLSTLAGIHLAFKTASLRYSVQSIKPETGLATKYIKCSNMFVHKGQLCHPSLKEGENFAIPSPDIQKTLQTFTQFHE